MTLRHVPVFHIINTAHVWCTGSGIGFNAKHNFEIFSGTFLLPFLVLLSLLCQDISSGSWRIWERDSAWNEIFVTFHLDLRINIASLPPIAQKHVPFLQNIQNKVGSGGKHHSCLFHHIILGTIDFQTYLILCWAHVAAFICFIEAFLHYNLIKVQKSICPERIDI